MGKTAAVLGEGKQPEGPREENYRKQYGYLKNRMKDVCKQGPRKITVLLPKTGAARLVREDAQSPLSAIVCSRGQNQTCLETSEKTGPAREQVKG